jgi:hypothetical protein
MSDERQQIIYRAVNGTINVEYVRGRLRWWQVVVVWLCGYSVGYEGDVVEED